MRELKGTHDGQGLRVGIVAARFNEVITARLLRGALTALYDNSVRLNDIDVARVPGSFEVPTVARAMAKSGQYNAVICLGAVIRGETDHYAHIAGEAARGIASASAETGVPVIFGILTTNTVEQALARSGGQDGESVKEHLYQRKSGPGGSILKGNVGYTAGLDAIEMANLMRQLSPSALGQNDQPARTVDENA
jgi:6,7-dimethyl-8-ribityllumazine synthase